MKRVALACCWIACWASALAGQSFPVKIRVDAAQRLGPLQPVWRFFGADEPNYAYMPHGKKLLEELGSLAESPLPNAPRRGEGTGIDGNKTAGASQRRVYFRAHNLLTSGDGTPALKWGSTGAYREDAAGKAAYDWTILDQIFDAYRDAGVTPYVEIGFMPRELSTRPEPYQHHWGPRSPYDQIFTGWAHPPRNYAKWGELVYQWVRHCLDRYGRQEVESWYWETWNEANAGYWQGTRQEFFKLHDYAVDAVRRALPTARVGGPDAAGSGGDWTRAFLEHALRGTNYATGKVGGPLDFVSFHAKGAPTYVDGRVRMGIAAQLTTIDEGFQIVASFPELANTPIVIGECDPEGCAACQGPQLAYRNGTMYASYTAASFARLPELAARRGVNLEGALTWAFEFEGQPLFAGFRSLATGGIDKPVLNVFRMFGRMQGERLAATSDHAVALDKIVRDGVRGEPDVGALASGDGQRVWVLLWHYHDDDVPGPAADVELTLAGLPPASTGGWKVRHYRVDETHSNAFAAWQRMGSPPAPTDQQYAQLERAGQLAELAASEVDVQGGAAKIQLSLPRQGVALVVVEP